MAELRQELLASSGKKDKQHLNKRIALKRIVANMTMSNNDMIALFPDVINCMTIASLEIKKMYVYALLRNISSSPAQVLLVSRQLCARKTGYCAHCIAGLGPGTASHSFKRLFG